MDLTSLANSLTNAANNLITASSSALSTQINPNGSNPTAALQVTTTGTGGGNTIIAVALVYFLYRTLNK